MEKPTGKVLIAGGSGLVGTVLQDYFKQKNIISHILSRSCSSDPLMHTWDTDSETIETTVEDHRFDALINLSGAGIADKRWTKERKKVLYDSRIKPTRFLWSLIKQGRIKTERFIQISASGYYGDRNEPVTEQDAPGSEDNFMVQLTKDWEKAFTENASAGVPGTRVRLGVVISSDGGFLERFIPPVKMFAAPYFGDGENYISWIYEDDLSAMMYCLVREENLGPVYNIASPQPVTSREFSQKLRKVYNAYAIPFPVPEWVVSTIFGEMKKAILADVKMMPAAFQDMGYRFKTPSVEEAMKKVKND